MAKRSKETTGLNFKLPANAPIDASSFLHHPHDKFLKAILSIKEVAVEFLRFCLPPEKFIKLDLSTLDIENNSFIDKKMKTQYADTVFSIKTNDSDNIRLSLIWEFKSDKGAKPVIIQLLGYAHAALESDIKQKRQLRPPVSIVIYHGAQRWDKVTMLDLFPDTPSEFVKYIPSFDYIMLNINELSDEQIIQLNYSFLPNILLVLKNGRDPVKVIKYFDKMLIFADENEDVVKLITEITLLYLSFVSKLKLKDMDTLIEKMPTKKASILKGTFAYALKQKKAEGEAIGTAKGKIEMLLSLMKEFPDLTDAKLAAIAKVENAFVQEIRKELEGNNK